MNTLLLDDTRLSVWGLVGRVQQKSLTLYQRRTMNIISHAIEDTTLVDQVPTRIYAGFQRMSKFLPQVKRYTRMASAAQQIFIFGVPDVELPELPNVTYVFLERDSVLAREWFLIARGEHYASALVTQEKTRFDDPDHLRKFEGIWTFEVNIIDVLDEWLRSAVSERDFAARAEMPLHIARQQQLVKTTLNRLDSLAARAEDAAVRGEVTAIKQEIVEALP